MRQNETSAQLVLSCLPCPALPQGRNALEQVKMLQRIEQHNARQPPEQKIQVSVEVEKPREELYQLLGYGDVVSIPHGPPLATSSFIWSLKGVRVSPCPACHT